MPITAGRLNRRLRVEREEEGTDDWGGRTQEWVELREGYIRANIKSPAGFSAARTAQANGLPITTVVFSVRIRRRSQNILGIRAGDRFHLDSSEGGKDARYLYVKGVIPSGEDLTYVDFLCTEEGGGNERVI